MNLKKTIALSLLFILLVGSICNLVSHPSAVCWFANSLCVLVTGLSVAVSDRRGMDISFFTILVFALCVVSLAIAWGQWFVLGTGAAEAMIVPLGSAFIWLFQSLSKKKPSENS
tara:strand:- start:78 stop:419 length:342 start_codon:yes stop_codon:yes gene_type:complete